MKFCTKTVRTGQKKSKGGVMFKFKTVDSAVTRAKRKERLEKAKTITIVTIIALAVGFATGFKAQEALQTKYTKVVPVAQAATVAPEATATPAPQSK